jgi:NADH:ubiquinone oxidoreductase subunit H
LLQPIADALKLMLKEDIIPTESDRAIFWLAPVISTFTGLTAFAVIVLRRKMPDAPRPYRAWGYPYATLAFVAAAGWFVYNTLLEDPRDAAIGIALLLVSLPAYWYWRRR